MEVVMMVRLGWILLCGVGLATLGACGEDSGSGGTGDDTQAIETDTGDTATDTNVVSDTGANTDTTPQDTGAQTDTTVPDTSEQDTTPPEPGEFGAPCQGNVDCFSGWCVESNAGYICTNECLETCPQGFDCKSVQNSGGDVTFLCLPRLRTLCVPCLEDFQCNGGACLTIDGEGQCSFACDDAEDCPGGFACATADGREGNYCQPVTGSCSCSTDFAGVQRTCQRGNDLGTCYGVETCDANQGWRGCSASVPVEELCNGLDDDCNGLLDDGLPQDEACQNVVDGVGSCDGVNRCFGPAGWVCQGPSPELEVCDFRDNNCDGSVDEGFATGGLYDNFDHCGTCNRTCAIGFPNAASTLCQADGETAACVVDECDPGFIKVNNFQCGADVGSLCQACTTDAQCVGTDAACVTLDDGTFCATACETTDECTTGFVCSTIAGVTAKQCVPASNACSCDGTNTDLSRACSVTFTPVDPNQPSTTCNGLEQCTADGWATCALPEEMCDGIDNDCNGGIDEPFRTGGRYTTVPHCGACGINCAGFPAANATPICDTDGQVPFCAFTCTGGAVDVNGIADDGCECVPVPGDDLAGDSVDSN
ncbi:MAG: hypothetical protein ACI9MR_004640, partial [Myxococcota bacterium]